MEEIGRIGLIADDDAYFRLALSTILTQQFSFSDVLEASSIDGAVEILDRNAEIYAALFDVSTLGVRTPSTLRAVRECFPTARVVVVSECSARDDILSSLEAGVHGYLLKSMSIAEMTSALKTVFDGNIYVPALLADLPPVTDKAVCEETRDGAAEEAKEGSALTARQKDVLDLLVQGKTNKEIALALEISEGTVKIHMASIFRYFGVTNRAAAAVAGARPYPNRRRNPFGGQ